MSNFKGEELVELHSLLIDQIDVSEGMRFAYKRWTKGSKSVSDKKEDVRLLLAILSGDVATLSPADYLKWKAAQGAKPAASTPVPVVVVSPPPVPAFPNFAEAPYGQLGDGVEKRAVALPIEIVVSQIPVPAASAVVPPPPPPATAASEKLPEPPQPASPAAALPSAEAMSNAVFDAARRAPRAESVLDTVEPTDATMKAWAAGFGKGSVTEDDRLPVTNAPGGVLCDRPDDEVFDEHCARVARAWTTAASVTGWKRVVPPVEIHDYHTNETVLAVFREMVLGLPLTPREGLER